MRQFQFCNEQCGDCEDCRLASAELGSEQEYYEYTRIANEESDLLCLLQEGCLCTYGEGMIFGRYIWREGDYNVCCRCCSSATVNVVVALSLSDLDGKEITVQFRTEINSATFEFGLSTRDLDRLVIEYHSRFGDNEFYFCDSYSLFEIK